jgi:acyl-CoA thioesterase-1
MHIRKFDRRLGHLTEIPSLGSTLPGHRARQLTSDKADYGNVQSPRRGRRRARVRTMLAALAASLLLAALPAGGAHAAAMRIVAFGDSLTAGYGLPEADAFPARLEAALRAKGHDVEIVDAGVSGDTASAGMARLDWSLADGADGVILELGANDALRGVDPSVTRAALNDIITRLKARGIEVLLAGMRSPPNMGAPYIAAFEAIYPELAQKHGILLYPFIVEGVATKPELNQADGIHPNAAGVKIIVERFLPTVEELIARIRANNS